MNLNELIAEVRMLRVLMSVALESLPYQEAVQDRLAEVIQNEIDRAEAIPQKSVADRIFVRRMKEMRDDG